MSDELEDNQPVRIEPQRRSSYPTKEVTLCERCGHLMYEHNCKIFCPNCGNRFDCSDLNIYFD
jgi:rubrerythrin